MNTPSTAACADFDFLVGTWSVRHRKLGRRLANDRHWIEFKGTATMRPMLGGLANIEENVLDDPAGTYRALALRTYSPATQTWSIHWVDGRNPVLDPPVHGRFEDDVGTFHGDDVFEGRPIRVRFLWTKLDPDHARWEQAFSPDGGTTWETNWTMEFSRVLDARQWCGASDATGCQVVELRQYRLHPGKREALVQLFDQQFVESQEAAGMAVLAQFRDLDDPDRFVWLRGFADMSQRVHGLTSFYAGPTWRAYRNQANATMIDSDNVLLLRPAWPGAGLAHCITDRPLIGSEGTPAGFTHITVLPLHAPPTAELLDFCRTIMQNSFAAGGARSIAWYVTEESRNTFPGLPVREGEHVLVGIALFDSQACFEAFRMQGDWSRSIAPKLAPFLSGEPQSLHLQPTARSALRLVPGP